MPQTMAASRVITVAWPDFSAGINAAVKSPLPMSSARAAATCRGKSAGADTDERTGPVIYLNPSEGQTVHRSHHAHQHRNGQQKVGPRGIQGDLARLGLLLIGGWHDPQNFLLVGPDQSPDIEQHDGAQPCADAD